MKYLKFVIITIATLSIFLLSPTPGFALILGTAENFAILAGSTVTNTGNTTVNGDIGVWAGTAYTGSGTVLQTGAQHLGDAVAQVAQGDLTAAYNGLAGMPVSLFGNLTGQDLGGLTLSPGVYNYTSSAQLTNTLYLDAQGFNNVSWVFQIGTTLITAPNSVVEFVNLGTNNGADNGVYWQVGTSATIDIQTVFKGNILANSMIVLNTGATLDGRALARIEQVTLQGNTINKGLEGGLIFDENGEILQVPATGSASAVPEPTTMLLFGLGLLGLKFRKN